MRAVFKVVCGMLVATWLAAGCSNGDSAVPSQRWGDVIVQVETRPFPVETGMNEVLVIATDERGRPASELRVSARADDSEQWKQLIQDGLSGVYRRAVLIRSDTQRLQIELREGERAQVLYFPLRP